MRTVNCDQMPNTNHEIIDCSVDFFGLNPSNKCCNLLLKLFQVFNGRRIHIIFDISPQKEVIDRDIC